MQNDALSPPGERHDVYGYMWRPPARLTPSESYWLHPVPFAVRLNATAADPAAWRALSVRFCGQTFASGAALRAAHARGAVRVCAFRNATGSFPWEYPTRATPPSPPGARAIAPARGARWGAWEFTVSAQRPSTGPALLDVRFGGERVLYELSLQDAMAAYAGGDRDQFFYADAAWSLSMLSASLERGVDCPEGAVYLGSADAFRFARESASGVEADASRAEPFFPACVFEWTEDHTVWRHMDNTAPPRVHGLLRRTVVVRSIATVGNYDYITDFKLREDGEIEVSTRFAGYIESRHFDAAAGAGELEYSTRLRADLAGPVHSHIVCFKADLDVGGARANAARVTSVETSAAPTADGHVSKVLRHREIAREGAGRSTLVADPARPGVWSVVDRAAVSPETGNARGYAISLGSFASTQTLPDDHPFVRAMPYSKWHVAFTRQHDDEYRVTSPYVQYDAVRADGANGAQDLERFLADEEGLLDEDLVAWISVGREHVTRQEDLPLVSNFGVAFSLQPWNFLPWNAAASGLSSETRSETR